MVSRVSTTLFTFALAAQAAIAGGGTVKGKVSFDGATIPPRADLTEQIKKFQEAPGKEKECTGSPHLSEDLIVDPSSKGIQWVFVSIDKVPGGKKLEVPSAPIVSDQKTCNFQPHLLVIPKGAKLELKNSDGFMHNTHSWSQKNTPFNEGIPAERSITKEFRDSEKVKLTCDVHPWMKGYIIVTDTAYTAVTGKDGSFTIADLPAGEYTVKYWHETLGAAKLEKVKVEEGKTATADVKMAPKGSG